MPSKTETRPAQNPGNEMLLVVDTRRFVVVGRQALTGAAETSSEDFKDRDVVRPHSRWSDVEHLEASDAF